MPNGRPDPDHLDWVPETPRGYVRDIRVRWALEEAISIFDLVASSGRNVSVIVKDGKLYKNTLPA